MKKNSEVLIVWSLPLSKAGYENSMSHQQFLSSLLCSFFISHSISRVFFCHMLSVSLSPGVSLQSLIISVLIIFFFTTMPFISIPKGKSGMSKLQIILQQEGYCLLKIKNMYFCNLSPNLILELMCRKRTFLVLY